MTNSMLSILFLLLLVTIEFISDIFVKKWTLGQASNFTLFLTFFIFISAFVLWILAMKVETFSKVVNFYALLSVLGGSILGYIFFQDKITTINIFGIFLALISIVLIGY